MVRSLGYRYDALGDVTTLVHPDGVTFTFNYDALGRMNYGYWWTPATGTVPAVGIGYDDLGRRTVIYHGGPQAPQVVSLLSCTLENANKASLAPAAHALLGKSGIGGFVADAFGNPVSGAIDLHQSAGSGSAGGHSFLYNGAQTVFAGPAMGFSAAFKGVGGGPIDMLSVAVVGLEWGTGVGEAKLAYDSVTAVGAFGMCAFSLTK